MPWSQLDVQMAASALPRNCTETSEGCRPERPQQPPVGQVIAQGDRTQHSSSNDTKTVTTVKPTTKTVFTVKPTEKTEENNRNGIVEERYHPIYGKIVRIKFKDLDEEEVEEKARGNASTKSGGEAGPGPGDGVRSTLVVPVTAADTNGTAYVIDNLRRVEDAGAGSPDRSAILVPAVFGGILAVAVVMVLVALLLRRKRKKGLFRRTPNKNLDIEMDTIKSQTLNNPGQVPTYAQVDKSRKRNKAQGKCDQPDASDKVGDNAHVNGSQRSLTISMRHSRASLPLPPVVAPIAEHDTSLESEVENVYETPGGETPDGGVDDGVENVYESAEDAEYALYDAAHRQEDGIKPDPAPISNGFIPYADEEEHIYESTEGEDHIYEPTEWPTTRAPLPPFRPMSLPVMKTPPQIRPGHLLPKNSRPNTIGASPDDVEKGEYTSNMDDYEAYLAPICHNHSGSLSPYHSYDPVYEKRGNRNKSSNLNSSGQDENTTSNMSSGSKNKSMDNGVASDSDSSVYEYIEGGDNRHLTLRSERAKSRTESMAVHVDENSRSDTSAQNTRDIDENEYEHEYTPLIQSSSKIQSTANNHVPDSGEDHGNIYEPYSFQNQT